MWGEFLKKVNHSHTPQKAIKAWGGKKNSVRLVSEGINLVYRFEANNRGNYLRITHPALRSRDELAAAIEYQEHLFLSGAPVCEPVKSLTDHYIESVLQDDENFLAHVNAEVQGTVMHFDYTGPRIYQSWGQALGRLHQAAKSFEPSDNFEFKHWQDLWAETQAYLDPNDEAIQKEFILISQWLKTLVVNKNNFGIVHHDHRTGNVLCHNKEIHIIDFDEPIYHWYAADVVRPFLEVSQVESNNILEKWLWYIEGYCSIETLTEQTLNNMPWFLRMKNIEIYLWIKNNWRDEVAPGGTKTEVLLTHLRKAIEHPQEKLFE